MAQKSTDFPGVRLVVASCLSLVLIIWAAFFDDSWKNAFPYPGLRGRYPTDSLSALMTMAISFVIVAILFPVVCRGPKSDRWLVAILAIVPLAVVFLTAIGLWWSTPVRY